MKRGGPPSFPVCLNPSAVRSERKRQRLTQRALAEKAGFTEDYISQIERRINRPTTIETCVRLANALDMPVESLVFSPDVDLTEARGERQQLFQGLHVVADAVNRAAQSAQTTVATPVAASTMRNAKAVLDECEKLRSQGLWLRARNMGLESRSQFVEHGTEWTLITVEQCALMSQQSGNLIEAEHYLNEAEAPLVESDEDRDPYLQAVIDFRRAWISCEQYGNFPKALIQIRTALAFAQEAGDRTLENWVRHFHARIVCDAAVAHHQDWMRASSSGPIPDNIRRVLDQDYSRSLLASDDGVEGAYLLFRGLVAGGLADRPGVLHEFRRRESTFRNADTIYFHDLFLAKCAISDREWRQAVIHAQAARAGYVRVRFPQGIAVAAAVEAHATARQGALSADDVHKCLDLWALVILLHAYPSHKFYQFAVRQFADLWIELALTTKVHRSYFLELDNQIRCREGVFASGKGLYVGLYPAGYVRSLVEAVIGNRVY